MAGKSRSEKGWTTYIADYYRSFWARVNTYQRFYAHLQVVILYLKVTKLIDFLSSPISLPESPLQDGAPTRGSLQIEVDIQTSADEFHSYDGGQLRKNRLRG